MFSEHTSSIHTADWNDVSNKATRLVSTGQVMLHRNGYNNIVATVVGDHGVYRVEIGRDDPNSQAISTWTCECPWSSFAWDRTGDWKKYEGRVCSHTLAAYWLSRKTPLDEDTPEDADIQRGQQQGPAVALPPPPDLPYLDQTSFSPDEKTNAEPQNQNLRQELQEIQDEDPDLFDFGQMSDTEKSMRDQFPGLFGYSSTGWQVTAADDFDTIHGMINPGLGIKGQQPTVKVVNQDGVWGELRGGKIPVPGAQPQMDEDTGATMYHREGHPVYHWKNLGWDPKSGENLGARGPEERGRQGRVPFGSTATVLDTDPNTRQMAIVYYTNGYKLQPRLIKSWVDPKDVRLVKTSVPPHRQVRR